MAARRLGDRDWRLMSRTERWAGIDGYATPWRLRRLRDELRLTRDQCGCATPWRSRQGAPASRSRRRIRGSVAARRLGDRDAAAKMQAAEDKEDQWLRDALEIATRVCRSARRDGRGSVAARRLGDRDSGGRCAACSGSVAARRLGDSDRRLRGRVVDGRKGSVAARRLGDRDQRRGRIRVNGCATPWRSRQSWSAIRCSGQRLRDALKIATRERGLRFESCRRLAIIDARKL